MRILNLAKELGVSYERLLAWCAQAGLSYTGPDDLVEPADEKNIRQVFAARRPKGKDNVSQHNLDELVDEIMDPSAIIIDGEIPETLEELEALERRLMEAPPELRRDEPAATRTPTREVLDRYGIHGKSLLKRLRKLLPGHAARLLNQQDLSEAQRATLTGEIESHAVFHCGDPYCRSALTSRHDPETVFPAKTAKLCELCRGSATIRALEQAAEACRTAGVRRILVIGGMPAAQAEIKNNEPSGVEFRLVAGDLDRDRQRVQADLRWCDLAIIWGGTILHHFVRRLHQPQRAGRTVFSARAACVRRGALRRADQPSSWQNLLTRMARFIRVGPARSLLLQQAGFSATSFS